MLLGAQTTFLLFNTSWEHILHSPIMPHVFTQNNSDNPPDARILGLYHSAISGNVENVKAYVAHAKQAHRPSRLWWAYGAVTCGW